MIILHGRRSTPLRAFRNATGFVSNEEIGVDVYLNGNLSTCRATMPIYLYIYSYTHIFLYLLYMYNYTAAESVYFVGQFQCLVQLAVNPIAVCHGTGASKELAEYVAAHNALQYLKVMAKAEE